MLVSRSILYTDHKPALFENSLSNKGQLSAWKLTEVADLMAFEPPLSLVITILQTTHTSTIYHLCHSKLPPTSDKS
jgi:hypothetical protein